jgi:hypothetical protein
MMPETDSSVYFSQPPSDMDLKAVYSSLAGPARCPLPLAAGKTLQYLPSIMEPWMTARLQPVAKVVYS